MTLSDEELQVKKESVLQYTRVGLAAEKAFELADLPPDVREFLEKDEIFMKCVNQGQLELEVTLLKDLMCVEKVNIGRGKSDEIRFMLGVLDPARYASGGKKITVDPGDNKVVVNIGAEYKGL